MRIQDAGGPRRQQFVKCAGDLLAFQGEVPDLPGERLGRDGSRVRGEKIRGMDESVGSHTRVPALPMAPRPSGTP